MSIRMRVLQKLVVVLTRWASRREPDIEASRRAVAVMERTFRLPRGVTMTVDTIAGVTVRRYSSGSASAGVVLHLHGGAYYCGSSMMGRCYARIAACGGPDLVSVDYRLAPEHPYPVALHDALAVYHALAPTPVVVVGDSAGGGLALALVQRLRADGLAPPAGVAPIFPWADLTQSGASYHTSAGHDILTKQGGDWAAAMYAADQDRRTPGISPVFGSFVGFPRTLITVGARDSLVDDARAVAAALQKAGAEVTVNEVPGAVHGFTTLPTPEAREAIQVISYFVRDCLSRVAPTII